MALLAEHAQKLRRMKLGPYQVGTGRPSPPANPSLGALGGFQAGPGWMSSKASMQPGLVSSAQPLPAGAGSPPSTCAPDCHGGRAKSLSHASCRRETRDVGLPPTALSCPRGSGPLPALISSPPPDAGEGGAPAGADRVRPAADASADHLHFVQDESQGGPPTPERGQAAAGVLHSAGEMGAPGEVGLTAFLEGRLSCPMAASPEIWK